MYYRNYTRFLRDRIIIVANSYYLILDSPFKVATPIIVATQSEKVANSYYVTRYQIEIVTSLYTVANSNLFSNV